MSRPAAMTAREALALLGLSGPAAPETLAAAFRAQVKAARPDREGGDPERYRRVIEAYRLLQRLQVARAALAPPDPAPAAEATPDEGCDRLEITALEAVNGVARTLRRPDRKPLGLRLPAGLRAGEVVRLKGQGRGGEDLLLTVRITPEAGLSVVGDDLWLHGRACARVLRDGGRLALDTPLGPRTVWAPPGLEPPYRLRLKHQGLPARGGFPRGHLFLALEPEARAEPGLAETKLRRFRTAWAGAGL